MIQTIRVAELDPATDTRAADLLRDIRQDRDSFETRTAKVIRLEGITGMEALLLAESLLHEKITQRYTINEPLIPISHNSAYVEIAYKPGIMNPESASILKAAHDLGVANLVAVDTSIEYHQHRNTRDGIASICERFVMNKTVQCFVTKEPKTLLIAGAPGPIMTIPIRELDDEALLGLSKDKLFLNLEEMRVIQAYFLKIGRDPTDAELETLAQTWSEHCGHKTFSAKLIVNGEEKEPLIVRLKRTAEGRDDLIVSCFHDNSGVLRFYDGWAICGKVETHNSPSAIEPYGGAMTGSGGVFRDILGTGQGAKVILSTDMFCLAPPDLDPIQLPPGCLHPQYLLRHVVRGVKDYGNRMGIPTSNGSFHFHPDFRAKPSVIVGAYGLIPEDRAQKGTPQPGDCIIAIGGRTGRDGIHGATFSSAEMTERTVSVNGSAVQIGNAIEEKRLSDALLACRDANLIRAVTDCGAGGFSSAIGEMGSKTGVCVALERAPLKYPGLSPWEIWISESQERMVLAVAPEHVERVLSICSSLNVEATNLGEFTDNGRLVVTYNGDSVCDLVMEFLHNGLPQRTMTAKWVRPTFVEPEIPYPTNWTDIFCRVMAHRNVCSKEQIVRLYDHGVQGTNALPPYGGAKYDAPNDAVVLRPLPDKPYGMVVSHGVNPILNRIDPYWGSMWAIVEALSNYVAVGGNPNEAGLIDNFIWPFPDEDSLGALDLAVDACVDAAKAFGLPFVSGKDSLSSTYRGKDGTVIKIPPVLCISVFGRIPDVSKTVTSDFKRPGESVILLRGAAEDDDALGGSVYYDLHGGVGSRLPHVDVSNPNGLRRSFAEIHQDIVSGRVLACHDVSEGGIAITLAEMCFGGDCGAEIDVSRLTARGGNADGRLDLALFNETPGRFLLEKTEDDLEGGLFPEALFIIGRTIPERTIRFVHDGVTVFSVSVDELKAAWKAPMKEVFP